MLVLFIFIIILSVFRRYPASAYPFDIIKFSLYQSEITLLFLFVCLFNFVLFYLFYCVIQTEKLKKNMSCSNTTKIVTYLLFQSYQAYFIQRVSLVRQELLTFPEHLRPPRVRVTGSLVFCVVFCRSLFVMLSFLF